MKFWNIIAVYFFGIIYFSAGNELFRYDIENLQGRSFLGLDFGSCGNGEGIAHLSSLAITPDPLSLSEKAVAVSGSGTLTEDVTNATLKVDIWRVFKVLGINTYKYIKCPFDDGCAAELCSLVESCPLKAGDYEVDEQKYYIPDLTPVQKFFVSGNYYGEVRLIEDSTQKELSCHSIRTHLYRLVEEIEINTL